MSTTPEREEAQRAEALRIVLSQADDEGLWFKAQTASEAYLQNALRELHRAIEAAAARQSAPEDRRAGVVIDAYAIPVEDYRTEIKIQRMRQIEGPALWKVARNGDCLNKSGEWEYEPMPSSRDDEFLARCRFDTAEEAIAAAMKA